MSSEALEYGRAKNEQALHRWLEAEKNDNYNPYNLEGPQIIELGDLYYKKPSIAEGLLALVTS